MANRFWNKALSLAGALSLVSGIACYGTLAAVTPNTVLKAAASSEGKKMWSGYGLPDGTLGCAAALSNVLNLAGAKQARSAAVRVVYKQLQATPGVSQFKLKGEADQLSADVLKQQTKPGDVVLAFMHPPPHPNGGPHAHCGIMGPNGEIYTNDWNDGIWKLVDFRRYFSAYKHFYVFRFGQKT